MNKFSINSFLLCLIIGVLGSFTMVRAQNGEAVRAKELWEQVIIAKGGHDRLYAVHSLVVSTKTKNTRPTKDFPGHHFESLFVLPDKWWFWADERPGLGLSIWTYDFDRQAGQEIWDLLPTLKTVRPTGSLTNSADQSSNAKSDVRFRFIKEQFIENQLIYLMETRWLQPTIVRARIDQLGSVKVDVIETSYDRKKFEFYIDRKTHLPMQVIVRTRIEKTGSSADGKDYADRFILGDYIAVAGIKFPRIIRRGGEENETTYQVNVIYVKSIFEHPPTINMGQDAWKPSQ